MGCTDITNKSLQPKTPFIYNDSIRDVALAPTPEKRHIKFYKYRSSQTRVAVKTCSILRSCCGLAYLVTRETTHPAHAGLLQLSNLVITLAKSELKFVLHIPRFFWEPEDGFHAADDVCRNDCNHHHLRTRLGVGWD